MTRIPIERQARQPIRDGLLVAVGIVGLVVVELSVRQRPIILGSIAVREFLFGCALGVMFSGIFRATARQAAISTLALGVGFGLGAVVDIL